MPALVHVVVQVLRQLAPVAAEVCESRAQVFATPKFDRDKGLPHTVLALNADPLRSRRGMNSPAFSCFFLFFDINSNM